MPLDDDQQPTDAAAAPSQDSGQVELEKASIEDIDAALASAQEKEASEAPATEVVDDSTATDPNTQNTEQPVGDEPAAGATKEAPASGTVATPGADPSKPQRQPTAEELQAANAETERLKGELQKKESYIQQRGNELGVLKSQLATARRERADARAQLANGLKDRWAEDPQQASLDQKAIENIDRDLEAIDAQENQAETIVEAQTFFLQNVDTNQVSLSDMEQVLVDDGVSEDYVAKFKANPWLWTTPEALVQIGKRAMDRKQFVQADTDRRTLAAFVKHLNARIEELQKRPGQIMKQVQRNLNGSPSVTAQSTVSAKTARDLKPENMSIKELDAALAQASATQH